MAADLTMYEKMGFNIAFTLVAGSNFTGITAGQPIPRTALSRVFFYIKRPKDSAVLVTKSDEDANGANITSEIEWTNENGGLLTVKLVTADTSGSPCVGAIFELWGTHAVSGQPVLLDRGTIDILDSISV